jgi:hypothetical protein
VLFDGLEEEAALLTLRVKTEPGMGVDRVTAGVELHPALRNASETVMNTGDDALLSRLEVLLAATNQLDLFV